MDAIDTIDMADGTRVGGEGERPAPAAAAAAKGFTPAARADGSMPANRLAELMGMDPAAAAARAPAEVVVGGGFGGGEDLGPAPPKGELLGVNSEVLTAPTEVGVWEPPLVEALLDVSMLASVLLLLLLFLLRHIAIVVSHKDTCAISFQTTEQSTNLTF